MKLNKEEAHAFWRDPSPSNNPRTYLLDEGKSRRLLFYIRKYCKMSDNILEIGCNIGRNLNYLYNDGFKNLTAIEINPEAIMLLYENFPHLRNIRIHNCAIEDIITAIPDRNFNTIYTMAVLMHIHPDSEWVFSEIARIMKNYLIIVELEEDTPSHRVFKYDYKTIFENLGLVEIYTNSNEIIKRYTLRIFTHKKK